MDDRAEVAALVARAAAGEQAAYEALVERFGRLVWHIARCNGLTGADAADVSQTVWLRFVEQLDRIRDPGGVRGWLATTTRRECIAVNRRRARTEPVDLIDLEDRGQLASVAPVDAAHLEAGDRAAAVRLAFSELPERCRTLLQLLNTDPPTAYTDIAEVLGLAVGSIGPSRQRCLEQLGAHPAVACIKEGGQGSRRRMGDAP